MTKFNRALYGMQQPKGKPKLPDLTQETKHKEMSDKELLWHSFYQQAKAKVLKQFAESGEPFDQERFTVEVKADVIRQVELHEIASMSDKELLLRYFTQQAQEKVLRRLEESGELFDQEVFDQEVLQDVIYQIEIHDGLNELKINGGD